MKQYLAIFFSLFISFSLCAQKQVTGIWEGKINTTVSLRIIFHIGSDSTGLVSTMDSPDQGVNNIATTGTSFSGDSLTISLAQWGATYKGRLINDSVVEGRWMQGQSFLLNLKKVEKATALIRPQTPKSPFPYASEDVIYSNADKSIRYGATITIPKGKGPFPAVLLITGSGQQNRDEEILGHKPFAVLADFLSRNGYIVLRVDDRGMGETTGDVKNATSKDFANDAVVSLGYLLKRKEVNKNKVGLMGHSEGGMIAEMIAAERKDIAFIILLAAPGEKVIDLMVDQNAAIAKSSGLGKSYIDKYLVLYTDLLKSILSVSSEVEATQKATEVINNWTSKTDKNIVIATTGIHDESTKTAFVTAFVSVLTTPWFRYFLNYDPSPQIKRIHAKVLALNGDRDIQVVAAKNLPALKSALEQSSAKEFEVNELKGLNHLFQDCVKCTINEYGQIEETFSPAALEMIRKWLAGNIGY